jgi:hypothetical protein
MTWILTFGALAAILGHSPTLAPQLDTPATIVLDHGGRIPPLAPNVTVARSYKSEAQFASDAAAGTIPSSTGAVILDLESWSVTPLAEQRHPAIYERRFVRLAKLHGLRAIIAPARDLTARIQCASSRLPAAKAYVACNMPGHAARAFRGSRLAGTYMVPTQRDELAPSLFSGLFLQSQVLAKAAHRRIHVIAGLSTGLVQGFASGAEMYRALQSTADEGAWLSVDRNDPAAVAATADFFTLEGTA